MSVVALNLMTVSLGAQSCILFLDDLADDVDVRIGPSELNQNSVDHRNSPTATVVETMYMQRSIEDLTYGIWFSPVRRGSTSPGELSFG
jgi:hypothetical protein